MKIGIDCRTILNPSGGEQAGVGHYTYYLVKSLLEIDKHNTYVLFFLTASTVIYIYKIWKFRNFFNAHFTIPCLSKKVLQQIGVNLRQITQNLHYTNKL